VAKKNRYQQFKARALRSPKVTTAYEDGLEDLRIAVSLAELREQRGMTQTQLAARPMPRTNLGRNWVSQKSGLE